VAAAKTATNKTAAKDTAPAPAGKVRALSSAPNMVGLFVRAALGARGPHGKTTPTTTFTLNDQKIDIEHLAKFQKVCGFRASDVLPSTYLHILAFPLHMALMVEPEFPFPAPGSVHVNNTITQIRPVTVDEVVSIRVHAEDLRPHDAGRQIDLVSEAYVGDELVWKDRSTYLQRGKSSGESKPKAAPAVAETPGGVPAIVVVPDDIGRRYAAASGDPNPIHLHSITAKLFGFKTAIAHGMWVKARTLASLEGRLPDSYTVDIAFKTPVFLPAKIAIRAEQVGDNSWTLDVRNPRSGKPHLAGTIR